MFVGFGFYSFFVFYICYFIKIYKYICVSSIYSNVCTTLIHTRTDFIYNFNQSCHSLFSLRYSSSVKAKLFFSHLFQIFIKFHIFLSVAFIIVNFLLNKIKTIFFLIFSFCLTGCTLLSLLFSRNGLLYEWQNK